MTTVDEARAYLVSRGLSTEFAQEAKLRPGSGEFEGYVVFPWLDAEGTEVYATGRSLNGTEPRYRHCKGPRPALHASPGAWRASRVALVEGQVDATACAQSGTAAFACSGALTDEALEILRSKETVILALDADEHGHKLHGKAVDALRNNVELLEVTWPDDCKDAGDVAQRAVESGADPTEAVAEIIFDADPVEVESGADPTETVAEVILNAAPVEIPWQTSWGPDFTEGEDEPPALMARTDGQKLLYRGRRHWLQGEPESGKTFMALAAVAEVLHAGGVTLFIDFEDSRPAVVSRLEAMRAPVEKFIYVRPTEALEDEAVADVERLMTMEPALVVLDGVAEAMALHGLDAVRSLDTATFIHDVLDRFRGSTLVVIDHVARGDAGKGRYAYGSQHKLASVDGAAYRFEVIQTFSREQGGAARIDVAKDRPGFVRSFALGKDRAGVLRVVPDANGLDVRIEPPEVPSDNDDDLSYTQRRVIDVLEDEGVALSYQEIGDRLARDGKGKPLKRTTIMDALERLIKKGLSDGTRTEGGSPSTFWRTDGNRQLEPSVN